MFPFLCSQILYDWFFENFELVYESKTILLNRIVSFCLCKMHLFWVVRVFISEFFYLGLNLFRRIIVWKPILRMFSIFGFRRPRQSSNQEKTREESSHTESRKLENAYVVAASEEVELGWVKLVIAVFTPSAVFFSARYLCKWQKHLRPFSRRTFRISYAASEI